MRVSVLRLIIFNLFIISSIISFGQTSNKMVVETDTSFTNSNVIVTVKSGTKYTGIITSQSKSHLTLQTKQIQQLSIIKTDIKSITGIRDKHNAIKFGTISPFLGATNFSFETVVGNNSSIEAAIGVIGLGFIINHRHDEGIYASGAYKYYIPMHIKSKGLSHVLGGFYLKPTISFAAYNSDYRVFSSIIYDPYGWNGVKQYSYISEKVVSVAATLSTGLQIVIQNSILFDFNFGVGYGAADRSKTNNPADHKNHYSHVLIDNLAITGGLKFGILF